MRQICSSTAPASGSIIRAAPAPRNCSRKAAAAVSFRVAANVGAGAAADPGGGAGSGQQHPVPLCRARPDHAGERGNWRLAPVTVAMREGRVRLAGVWGNGLVVQSRLDALDLSILNAFSPGLGAGGRATGSLDFAQASGSPASRAPRRGSRSSRLHPHRHRHPLGAGGHGLRRQPPAGGRRRGGDHPPRRRDHRPGAGDAPAPAARSAGTWLATAALRAAWAAGSAITDRPRCRCPSPTCPATSAVRRHRDRRRFLRPGEEPAIRRPHPRHQPFLPKRPIWHADHHPRVARPLRRLDPAASSSSMVSAGRGTVTGRRHDRARRLAATSRSTFACASRTPSSPAPTISARPRPAR